MRARRFLPAFFWVAICTGLCRSNDVRADGSPEDSSPAAAVDPSDALLHSVELSIADRGPNRPWLLRIENHGDKDLTLVGDLRLLWFEVTVPGQKKPVECRLPKTMQISKVPRGTAFKLVAGEAFVRHFDPRFYCFAEGEQSVLVPGALLTPHYGWDDETKASWQKGKRVVTVLPAKPPFVLESSPDPEEHQSSGSTAEVADAGATTPKSDEAAESPESTAQDNGSEAASLVGVRHIDGSALALSSSYSVWSAARLKQTKPGRRQLRLRMVKGSDAETERNVTVTVGMTNQTDQPLRLYFRRDFLTFEISGPEGVALCPGDDSPREPERQAFLSLEPNRELQISTRLIEQCPRGTFAKPGFYLVKAKLNATYSGESNGIEAFVGQVSALSPKPVRVRRSEEPYLVTAPMPAAAPTPAGAAAAAPAAPPAVPVVPVPQPPTPVTPPATN